MPMDDLNDQLPPPIPGLVLSDENTRASESTALPLPMSGVVFSDSDVAGATVTSKADQMLVDEVKADRRFLVKLAKKAEQLRGNGELDTLPSGKKISDFKPGGKAYADGGSPQSLTEQDITAMMQSLEGNKDVMSKLREAYEAAFDDEGKMKQGKEVEAQEFLVAMKAQMLASQLASVSKDPNKIQIILNELRSLNVRGGGAAQSVIDAAQGQASGMLSAAIAAISAVAGGVASVVSYAANAVGSLFRSDDAQRFLDSLRQGGVDNKLLEDKQRIVSIKNDFNLLKDEKSELQLFKADTPFDPVQGEVEKEKLLGAVKNLMELKNGLLFASGGDVMPKMQANEQVVDTVRQKIDSIIAMQKRMTEAEKSGRPITDEERKALNRAKVELKTYIQENVMKAPAALSASRVASTAPTSGLRLSTETMVASDTPEGGRQV